MISPEDFIVGMPKTELHLHIEGSFEPDLVFKIAERNGLLPLTIEEKSTGKTRTFTTPDELREAYKFNDLGEFLDIYYAGAAVLLTEQDFYDLTMAYLEKVASQNVRYTEFFFDPQTHTKRGVPFETVINGITRAREDAQEKLGIRSELIMSYLRDEPVSSALETWGMAIPHIDKFIGIGLDSYEKPFPPHLFKDVYALAHEAGLKVMAHAGEEGPPEYIWEALDILKVDRIDHGNRCLEDFNLVARLKENQMALTLCPLSNLRLQVVKDLTKHPVNEMLELGLNATIHSDDPAFFKDDNGGGYMTENYLSILPAVGGDLSKIVRLAENSINASFAPDDLKQELLDELHTYVAACALVVGANSKPHPAP